MSLVDVNYILFLTQDNLIAETLERVSKRLGAHKIKHCVRLSQALSEMSQRDSPDLVIQDLTIIDKDEFLPLLQETRSSFSLVPVPVFALMTPKFKSDISLIESSDYFGYEILPLNETMLEEKIRELYNESYSYDENQVLKDVIEQNILHHKLKLAYRNLIPALRLKPKNVSYLLLYAKILLENKNYSLAEKVIAYILELESDNLSAKNILAKILILTERYEEGEKIDTE